MHIETLCRSLDKCLQLLTCHWWWSPWWHNICVVGSHQQLRCGTVHSDVSWPEWHLPFSAAQECCRSHYSPASGLAVGSAGLMWCYLLWRAHRWNTQETHKNIKSTEHEWKCLAMLEMDIFYLQGNANIRLIQTYSNCYCNWLLCKHLNLSCQTVQQALSRQYLMHD